MMKNLKNATFLCIIMVLLMITGCGHSDIDSDVSTAGTINFHDVIDTDAEGDTRINQDIKENADNPQDSDEKGNNEESVNDESSHDESANDESANKQSDYAQSQSDSELDGDIESIADNSVIINKIFHPSANTAVSYTEDSEKVLITVYFSEETEFEVWTVKNNGVNGDADTEKQQGAFSDLKQGVHINMTGSYEGDDFHANHVIIYNYV